MTARLPDYGIDAPSVIRNLALAGAALMLFGFLVPRSQWAWFPGAIFLVEAGYMVWSSRVGKLGQRDRLLSIVPWSGSESVLDLGCGKGLLLIGAAKRLRAGGRAYGIDIWQRVDLGGNSEQATVANARAEGVIDRIELRTADMRELPFPPEMFDVVVSSLAVHNVYDAAGRAKALAEIVRVLKPGGRVLLQDFRHTGVYAAFFRAAGLQNVGRSGLQWRIFPPARIVDARKTMVVEPAV